MVVLPVSAFEGSCVASRYSLLWIDLTVSVRDRAAATALEEHFAVHRLSALTSIDREILKLEPDAICFDYDYPTKQSLQSLQETKSRHRSVPILMLTVQHSESLAVWAFRSRVWDYLVKPLSKSEVDRCVSAFAEMMSYRDASRRQAAMPISSIPLEHRVAARSSHEPLALERALEYVERNYRDKVSSAHAAAICRLTTFQFSRLFKETYGLTFQEYVVRFRLREAGRLLKNPNAQIADVAFLVGFNDPSYFTKVFRRYTGVSPSRFIEAPDTELDPERLLEMLNGE